MCVALQKGPLNYSNWIKRNLYLLIGLSVATLKPPQENVFLKSWCRLLTLFTSWLSSSQLTPGDSPPWLCSAHCQAWPLVSGFQWQLSTVWYRCCGWLLSPCGRVSYPYESSPSPLPCKHTAEFTACLKEQSSGAPWLSSWLISVLCTIFLSQVFSFLQAERRGEWSLLVPTTIVPLLFLKTLLQLHDVALVYSNTSVHSWALPPEDFFWFCFLKSDIQF